MTAKNNGNGNDNSNGNSNSNSNSNSNDNSNGNDNGKYRGPSTALIAKCAISFAQDDGFCSERSEELDGVKRLEAVDGFG